MRSGGCAVQQELAGDAAAVMRQAVSLARRRGHAQVTPLHVASAVLSDAGGLLRAACLRSRASSHPLQCKALELCFNVALNRLATAGVLPAAPPAMFQFHAAAGHRAPALSNSLAAAFKRAQANQRRGGGSASDAEGQHHQHVAAKVELKQLVISILDDPSVSRVLREAGFASAEVKANVEKAVSSSEQSSNTANSSSASPNTNTNNPKESKAKQVGVVGDAVRVLDCMASGTNRCVVVVGESAAAAERVVKAVMDKVSKGELRRQHERLKNAQFVPFSAASFQRMPREEVEARAGDLCALVRECCAAGKGVVLVLEDLGYAAEAWTVASGKRSDFSSRGLDCYCPVEHAVMELSSLVRGGGGGRDKGMFWLLGFGASASYTSRRSGQPSLETVLGLHPVVVPDGGLALSLGGDSEVTHCSAGTVVAAASVPSWIHRCQGPVRIGSELTLSFSSPVSSPHCGFTHDDTNKSCAPWHDLMDRRQPLLNRRHDGAMAEPYDQLSLANPNSGSSNSVSNKSNSSDGTTTARRRRPKFTELTAENLKILCSALEARVPRHRDIAPGIASAVLQRRSGVTRTTRPTPATWLLFQGRDSDDKMAMAWELARLVFGSYGEFTCITAVASKHTPDPDHSGSSSPGGHHSSLKRQRSPDNEHGGSMQMFYEAIRENPHRVVLIDGVEHDLELEAGIMDAMASGTVRGYDGGVVSLEDSIVVCCEVFESMSSPRVSSPRSVKQRITSDVDSKVEDDGAEKGGVPRRFSLDLNACAIDSEGEDGSSSYNAMEILNVVDGVFFF
ncbi:protein SMAX1-LIKE 3-like [Miscanthus floridulus]|uniref:protein SMAX1-LIKE 3-like n=1 Tax=Miscanthus floridulus TaxID=154761 RepID=UPI003459A5D6